MRQLVGLSVAIFSLIMLPLGGRATVTGACNTTRPGFCTQAIDINPDGTQFTILLTNTGTGKGGFITADAFSLPGTLGATLVSSTSTSFTLISGDIKVVPVTPVREFLLTIDPTPNAKSSFQGGGIPKSGIAAGSTVTFVFNITGGTLADTFDNESSIFGSQVTRLRGSSHQRSDNAVASLATPGSFISGPAAAGSVTTSSATSMVEAVPEAASFIAPADISNAVTFAPVSIPEPASFVLLGLGLIAVRIACNRRNGPR